MPMFAVYYIPPADHPFYRVGSQIIGYDVRAAALLPPPTAATATFTAFDPAWQTPPQQFGLHVTIGHTLTFDPPRLPEIEANLSAILSLFDPAKPFLLTPGEPYLPDGGPNLTIYYDANQSFMMFHALVIARIHPLGVSHPLNEAIQAGLHPDLSPVWQRRVDMYHHYSILDDWRPHFGLLRPVPPAHREAARAGVLAALPAPEPMTVESICLLVRDDDETHFRIHREFSRTPASAERC